MITLTSNISTDNVTISSQNGNVVNLSVANNNLAQIEMGQHPEVTVSDPGLAQRVTDLETTIDGGMIM